MPVPISACAKSKRSSGCLHEGLSSACARVAASVQMPFTTAADHVRRARAAGLSWPMP